MVTANDFCYPTDEAKTEEMSRINTITGFNIFNINIKIKYFIFLRKPYISSIEKYYFTIIYNL